MSQLFCSSVISIHINSYDYSVQNLKLPFHWISFFLSIEMQTVAIIKNISWICCWNPKNCLTNLPDDKYHSCWTQSDSFNSFANIDRKHVSGHVTCSPWPHARRTAQERHISFCDTSISHQLAMYAKRCWN